MNEENIYARVSPLRLFFMIAIPGAISMIASSLWGVFDGIFVGKLLGDTAFAALNLAFPFVLLNFSLADLVGVGAAVNISILLGKKDEKSANNYFSCANILILLASILMGVIMYLWAPVLMKWMGAEGELARMAVIYLRVYALTGPLSTMIFAVDNFLRICGRIKSSMALNIIMSILILGLEYFCLGVLNMGIGGSALAVSAGMFICTLIALWPFVRGKVTLKYCRPSFNRTMIRQIVACGMPSFLSGIAGRLTSIVMNVVLLKLGGAMAISVYGVIVYAGDTLLQFLYGTCDGMQPAIGYNWGAGAKERVKGLMKCSVTACGVISLAGTMLMLLIPETIVSLFLQEGEQELVAMSVHALRIYGLTYLTRWFSFSAQNFLTALEISLPATILSVSNALIVPVVLLPILWRLKLDGIWMNTPITALVVTAMAVFFFVKMWRKINH